MDEKEELVTERDVYRLKYDRLNKELNLILKGDESRVLDVDALIMENRSRSHSYDLWLTCDHFVGEASAVGQPTRLTQPSIPPGLVNE